MSQSQGQTHLGVRGSGRLGPADWVWGRSEALKAHPRPDASISLPGPETWLRQGLGPLTNVWGIPLKALIINFKSSKQFTHVRDSILTPEPLVLTIDGICHSLLPQKLHSVPATHITAASCCCVAGSYCSTQLFQPGSISFHFTTLLFSNLNLMQKLSNCLKLRSMCGWQTLLFTSPCSVN